MKKFLLLLSVLFVVSCSSSSEEDFSDNNESGGSGSATKYTLTTSADPSIGGTVSPETGKYNATTTVKVTATPADGYEFVKWTGDNTSSDPTINIIMSSDKSVTATFAKPSFLVEWIGNNSYMIYKSTNSGSSWSKVSAGGTTTTNRLLQAEYGEGFHF